MISPSVALHRTASMTCGNKFVPLVAARPTWSKCLLHMFVISFFSQRSQPLGLSLTERCIGFHHRDAFNLVHGPVIDTDDVSLVLLNFIQVLVGGEMDFLLLPSLFDGCQSTSFRLDFSNHPLGFFVDDGC